MSFQLNMPPSAVAKLAKSAEEEVSDPGKRREDYKKLKELEEARKAGTVPAMQDEEGKDINPHIPQYIMQAPWYFGATAPTLKHQRTQEEKMREFEKAGTWYKKGIKQGSTATKYRKGACENCGAMTHKKKDCLERPRKMGAKYSGSGFAPDEHIPTDISLDYDGKRDRWNGYDIEAHKRITEEYAKIEEAKKHLRAEKVLQGEVEQDEDKDRESDEDELKGYADDVDMPGQKFESKQRITVRNLRIREDTAKYLYNLDVNSAHYDPKTRSMRENPFQDTPNTEKAMMFGGDNFVRWSGDAQNMAQRQVFAWEAYEKGADVHLQADPTKLEVLAREYKEKKEKFKDSQKQNILERYGGEEHLDAPPKQLLMAQTEDYIEYSRTGSVIKGQEKAKMKSMYEEDVFLNNHTSVWGSYWKDGQWGFRCCHSVIKESYCTGSAGKEAAKKNLPAITDQQTAGTSDTDDKSDQLFKEPEGKFQWKKKMESEGTKQTDKKKKKKKVVKKKKAKKNNSDSSSSSSSSSDSSSSSSDSSSSSSDSSSSDSDTDDEEAKREKKIKEAMIKEDIRRKEVDKVMALDERKRPYNSMYTDVAPNEEEMEAYRRKKLRSDDPMAQFLS